MAGSARAARRIAKARVRQAAHQAASKRAVGYVRVSTEEQAVHGNGLEGQADKIRSFATSQDYELVEIVEERGVSGITLPADRPGFGRVLELLRAGGVSVLLVFRFDRLARNIKHAITTVHDELNARDIELRSVTEPAIDTSTSMGRTIFAIFAGLAESERDAIVSRTKTGRITKARQGRIACGTPPYGYRRCQDGTLEVVEAEAKVVRLIFALRADGLLLQEIADRLNADGHLGQQGGIWRVGTVGRVLDNQKYRGALEWLFEEPGGAIEHIHVPGAVEAIIEG